MEIRTQAPAVSARPEETLPMVNPHARRGARVVGQAVGTTHRGLVREANEDHFLVADLERSVRVRQTSLPTPGTEPGASDAEGTLLMVADGMGGHGDGGLASAVTLDAVLDHVVHTMPWAHGQPEGERLVSEGLKRAVEHCQERLHQVAARKGANPTMGTTLTLVFVRWPDAFVAHVGDSRCYHLRGSALRQITRDHTLAQELRDRYAEAPEAAQFEHVLVNAVGGDRHLPEVESHHLVLEPGDRLLLCSDGLHGELDNDRIATLLSVAASPTEACHRLVSAAIDAGGHDNVTSVVAFF